MERKHRYFRIHFENGKYCVKDNSSNRSTVISDAPIFLDMNYAWAWLERTYPEHFGYVKPKSILI